MKKLVFSAMMLFFLTAFANAQNTQDQDTSKMQHKGMQHKTMHKKTGAKTHKMRSATDSTNQRKMYKSKRTGQSATPSGQEATGVNGTEARRPKNATNSR